MLCCVHQYPGACIKFIRFGSCCQNFRCFFFCSEKLVSSKRHTSELIVPGFVRPMQLLRGEVDRFRGLTIYVGDRFSANRQRSYYKC